jgi:hypothetical protein
MRALLLYLSLFGVAFVGTVAQAVQSVDSLLGDLAKPQTTAQAGAALLKMAEAQPSLLDELSNVLPNLILNSTDIGVVQSEAALAGKLKLVSAVPALIQLLDRPNRREGTRTFTRAAELYDDPVGRALGDIGNPAVKSLAAPLESTHVATRQRAARILIFINTSESLSVLSQHIGRETDDHLKGYMAASLARAGQ